MSAVLGKFEVTNQWQNLVSTYAGAASVDLALQLQSDDVVEIYPSSSGTAPTGGGSFLIYNKGDINIGVNAANVFVRCLDGNGATLAVWTA